MLWHLLVLQLLANTPDLLTELQPDSAQSIATMLATHTTAAASGMLPVFAAAAALAGAPLQPGVSQHLEGLCNSFGGINNSSSSSGCRSNSALAGPGLNGSNKSSNGSTATVSPGSFQPSLLHLSAQLCCSFPGVPEGVLPWLQLLARFHAFGDFKSQHAAARGKEGQRPDSSSGGRDEPLLDPSLVAQGRVVAMAVALQSLAAPLPALARKLCRSVQEQYHDLVNVPVVAAPVTVGASTAPGLQQPQRKAGARGSGLQPFLNRAGAGMAGQQQQQQAACCGLDQQLGTCAFWLHAERLLHVHPRSWQEHLNQHLFQRECSDSGGAGSNGSGSGCSSSTSEARVKLLADRACDWCAGGVPAAGSGPSSEAGMGSLWAAPAVVLRSTAVRRVLMMRSRCTTRTAGACRPWREMGSAGSSLRTSTTRVAAILARCGI